MSTLNIDNIANVAGTGAPDFVSMPTVAGDPVVESGSNSDGEWTRWADGTQLVTRQDFFTGETATAAGNVYSFPPKNSIRTMPQAFTSAVRFVVWARTASGSVSWASSGGSTTVALFPSEVRCMSAVTSSSDYFIEQRATGRWK